MTDAARSSDGGRDVFGAGDYRQASGAAVGVALVKGEMSGRVSQADEGEGQGDRFGIVQVGGDDGLKVKCGERAAGGLQLRQGRQ